MPVAKGWDHSLPAPLVGAFSMDTEHSASSYHSCPQVLLFPLGTGMGRGRGARAVTFKGQGLSAIVWLQLGWELQGSFVGLDHS